MASFEFPLLRKLTPLGVISDPKVPLVVHTLVGDITYQFLLDTGADFSLAPRRLAQQVGLNWERLPTAQILGVGAGAMAARVGSLPLRIGDVELSVRCMFVDISAAPFLLGRADILDRFVITLDAVRERITLTEAF